ncbi:FadR/GntR family transcriptional regulator [Alloscardovia venturai]|uniref:FadR/GntR family transcriptional regulator n=1 Tax=Alloscardovia venturai TaxID=1769421 RepID=A0ABW2Y8V6_9BIFI
MDITDNESFFEAANVEELTNSLTTDDNLLMSPRRRVDITMNAIKTYIIKEGLHPGDPLPTESELCEHLKTARSSIREALRKLEALDIVTVAHGRGTFVGNLSLEPLVEALSFRAMIPHNDSYTDLRDIIELRKILDYGMARQVIASMPNFSESEINRLREITRQMDAESAEGHTFLEQDSEFHTTMMRHVHNAISKQLAQSLWLVHMAVVPALKADITADLKHTAQAHLDILNAAIAGDEDAYRIALETHYAPIEEIIRQLNH